MNVGLKIAIAASKRTHRATARATSGVVTEDRLSDLVQGQVAPRAAERTALERVLGVPAAALFAGEDEGRAVLTFLSAAVNSLATPA
jgi:hypothetical protein